MTGRVERKCEKHSRGIKREEQEIERNKVGWGVLGKDGKKTKEG